MTAKQENTLLYRRFLIITLIVAIIGVLLAELISATRMQASSFVVHDRKQQWEEKVLPAKCDIGMIHCQVKETGLTPA